MFTEQELNQFIKIAETDYGVKLSRQQAFDQASNLVTLFETLINQGLDRNRIKANNGIGRQK